MKKEIGKRIQRLRQDMNMTKESFAEKIGISGQYLGLIEHGKNCLSVDKLKVLCDFTNTSADYILFGKNANVINDTKNILSEFTDAELQDACETLKNIALFIKSK